MIDHTGGRLGTEPIRWSKSNWSNITAVQIDTEPVARARRPARRIVTVTPTTDSGAAGRVTMPVLTRMMIMIITRRTRSLRAGRGTGPGLESDSASQPGSEARLVAF